MKYLFLFIIRLYWLIPKRWRRHCIFKETCSSYIYSRTKTFGFFEGFKALKKRYRQCRTHYSLYTSDDKKEWVILSDNSVVERIETIL